MTPHVFSYQNPDKQTVFFRGYVKEYTDSPVVIQHSCGIVRTSRYEAMKDAEKLVKQLKHGKMESQQIKDTPVAA